MPDKEFLDARALSESVRLFGRLTEDGQSLVDNLTQAGLAAPEVLAAAGIDPRFMGADALPRNPTPVELAALPAGMTLGGLYRPGGRVQRLVWDAQRDQWQSTGAPLPALAEVQEARAVADTASNLAEGATTRLTGLTNQAEAGPPPAGPAGIPETPRHTLTMTATLRGERVTYGIGANAALQSLSNQPGNRTQVTAVGTMPEIGVYGGVDHVTRFAEMVADPALYSVPTGAGTYTSTTVTASGLPLSVLLDSDGQPRAGMIIGTAHSPAWYGSLVSVSGDTITVNGWWRIGSGAAGTPANGTPALVNLMSKAWVDNCNLIIPVGAPISGGVIAEWGLMNNNVDSAGFNGLDIVSLGSKRVGTPFVVRSVSAAGAWAQGMAVQGVYDSSYSSQEAHGLSPVREFEAVANSQVAFYSQGTKAYHARFLAPDGTTERFSVDNNGNVSAAGSVQVGSVLEVMSGAIDLHTAGDGDFTVRLTTDATKTLYLIPAGGPARPIGTRAAASPDTTPAATGANPTSADFNALRDELHALKAVMRVSGLLD